MWKIQVVDRVAGAAAAGLDHLLKVRTAISVELDEIITIAGALHTSQDLSIAARARVARCVVTSC